MEIGKSKIRIDAADKVSGRAKYVDDLCDKSAFVAKILHSDIANGKVVSIDKKAAEKIPGVVRVVTCFDVKEKGNARLFPTAGHPWSTESSHQDVADRLVLTDRVRFYGDDIAAVVAENEIAAAQAVRVLSKTVKYEEFPFVLDPIEAMKDGAPQLHEKFPNNVLKHTRNVKGDYEKASKGENLLTLDKWYEVPTVQHCHIENFICTAQETAGRILIVSSTQIPHIARRIVGQALGIDWGKVRVIKPYIGGGFGNKQDVLYEPLCAYLCREVGGHLVKLDCSREETFVCNRVRHAMKIHIVSHVKKDGTIVARKVEVFSNQGAYASHGHSIAAKALGSFNQLYPCDNFEGDAYTVFTNRPAAGAMRGYGMPQATFAIESHTEDLARMLKIDSIKLRQKTLIPVGFVDEFSKNEMYFDSFNQCIDKAKKYIDFDKKRAECKSGKGDIRRGVGMAVYWYNTAVWPISLESSSCRIVMNQDGSVQLSVGETEIGQGADTAFAQMAADALGVPFEKVHIFTNQDTDITPFGTGAYASRQTYVAGFSIKQTALLLRQKILARARFYTRMPVFNLDIRDGNIVRTTDGRILMSIAELAEKSLYDLDESEHLAAESTFQIKSNAYSFGCSFAEVEVDVPLCRVQVKKIINVHDCGTLINPALAEAQVHGGISMGIGYGLSEELRFDEKTGKVLNGNLLDYKLSSFMDHPNLEVQFVQNPEPTSAFGTKALGEPPACPPAAAIRNAVLNATGVAFDSLPLNPRNLFKRFSEEGLIKQSKK